MNVQQLTKALLSRPITDQRIRKAALRADSVAVFNEAIAAMESALAERAHLAKANAQAKLKSKPVKTTKKKAKTR